MPCAYSFIPTPIGTAVAVRGDAGLAALQITRGRPEHALEAALARLKSPGIPDDAELADVATYLAGYFSGHRAAYTGPLDLERLSPFTREALEQIRRIPFAETAAYGEIAALAGAPRGGRAVGTACATTPLTLVVPVHRVVRADGSPGQYGAHPEVKRWLLAHEAARGAAA
ncbi:methylated-DNA--[protein]-cysteine S-methyltransferase [Microbacterium sp. LRZ72]|uniref:methylated-DNA--[protein]-cysteine S-methyltransferase n=1 Tax=Microbacterium sp. LRZ72 TaxID=2942481 RepID=UPI0029BE7EB6|nr:methylated-DNA--[protein]-cysteine S-methyltransferase [Microbacterium sp. LRZ72]MDX2375914.1 methylated-DNA--[protein]-cysteine S-methyltransferase [Microbacterium sp. LRZ72]